MLLVFFFFFCWRPIAKSISHLFNIQIGRKKHAVYATDLIQAWKYLVAFFWHVFFPSNRSNSCWRVLLNVSVWRASYCFHDSLQPILNYTCHRRKPFLVLSSRFSLVLSGVKEILYFEIKKIQMQNAKRHNCQTKHCKPDIDKNKIDVQKYVICIWIKSVKMFLKTWIQPTTCLSIRKNALMIKMFHLISP